MVKRTTVCGARKRKIQWRAKRKTKKQGAGGILAEREGKSELGLVDQNGKVLGGGGRANLVTWMDGSGKPIDLENSSVRHWVGVDYAPNPTMQRRSARPLAQNVTEP